LPEEFQSLEDWQFVLEELYFWWQLERYEDVTGIVIDSLLPSLQQWGYWSLQKEWLERVLPYTEGINHRICLQRLGGIYRDTGKWSEAEDYFNRSLTHAKEKNSDSGIAASLGLLGDIARKRGDYDKAEALYNQSLAVETELGDRAGMATSWGVLGDIARYRGDYDKAEALYNQSLAVRTELGDRAGMANIWGILGAIASKRENYDQAESLYKQYLLVCTELGNRAEMADIWGSLGENELERGNLEAAETWLKKALTVFEELQIPWKLAETSWDVARLYRAKGDEPQAQAHYSISHDLYAKLGANGKLEAIESEWL
jgi:tetratricopeptide (TPR) repeat protein